MRLIPVFAIAMSLFIMGSAQATPYGWGARCVAPYVSNGRECVSPGYDARRDGHYGGRGCTAPYVSVGGRCVLPDSD
jgi:hypothetical protein